MFLVCIENHRDTKRIRTISNSFSRQNSHIFIIVRLRYKNVHICRYELNEVKVPKRNNKKLFDAPHRQLDVIFFLFQSVSHIFQHKCYMIIDSNQELLNQSCEKQTET